ncbi:UNVERIFIED_CONTAM: hypothetical protein FKN15_030864 [Acipenser sinensis]
MWNYILERFDKTSKSIQAHTIELSVVVELLESLKTFLDEIRDHFDDFENHAMETAVMKKYRDEERRQS